MKYTGIIIGSLLLSLINCSEKNNRINICVYPGEPANLSLNYDGFINPSKLLWAFGNYSRFFRLGMARIYTSIDPRRNDNKSFDILSDTGFEDKDDSSFVVVVTDDSPVYKSINIKVRKGRPSLEDLYLSAFITSKSKDLEREETASLRFYDFIKVNNNIWGLADKKVKTNLRALQANNPFIN